MNDPLIEIIAKQSMARLDEMEKELDAQLERTRFELELVRRAKALKRPAGRQPFLEPVVAPSRRRGTGRSSKREPIKRVMETQPDRAWRPPEIVRALSDQGIAITRDGARVTMNRMVDEDLLVRLPNGEGYALARSGLASDTVSPAAPASANGENREMMLANGSPLGAG